MADKEGGDTCANPDRAQLGALSRHLGQREVYHPGVTCKGCGASRIYGIRYQCPFCVSFDLCERCEEHEERRNANGHPVDHALLKIRVPKLQTKDAEAEEEEEESFMIIGTAGPIGDNYDWK